MPRTPRTQPATDPDIDVAALMKALRDAPGWDVYESRLQAKHDHAVKALLSGVDGNGVVSDERRKGFIRGLELALTGPDKLTTEYLTSQEKKPDGRRGTAAD